jgi:iron complex transport system substrate-binding protein
VHRCFFALLGATIALASVFGLSGGSASAARSARPPRPAFPVTLSAANGEVTIEREPRRIVSLSATATEDLYAIGAGSQVIAVDRFSDYPSGTPRTELSGFRPNVEAIVGYRPDLVVVATDANNVVTGLTALRIPVLVHPPARNFAGAYGQIVGLGRATGHARTASVLVARMRARIAALVASVPARAEGRSVYHEISPDRFSATSGTFIGGIYRLFGLRNIADRAGGGGSGFPQLSSEYVVAADPDLIVLADTTCCAQSAATVAARPGWTQIAAVKRGAIMRLDDAIAARWGPRIVNFVRAVAGALGTMRR